MTEKVAKATKKRALYFSILGGMILCFALIYLLIGLQYKNRFFPNVMINEIDVSGMTAEQVQEDLNHLSKDYALYIQTRDDKEEILYGKDFGLTFQFEDADMIAQLIANQKFWKWGINLFPHTRYEISVMADYDKKKLESLIKGLSCMDSKKMVQPEDAYLTYDTDNGIHIVPEIKGSLIKVKAFREQVVEAVENVVSHISLEDLELYEEPKIYQDNQSLNERYNLWKQHLDTKIVYHFDENTEILDATIFYEWMSEDEKGGIVFDKERIQEFVKGLAKKYNTGYSSKEFETSYGETVTIKGGPYGWLINQPEEVDALEAALLACESQDREPVYFQTAASHSKPDYGDTYVEINLSAQHLFLYKDGELIVESDFVSVNESRGWATPAGAFPLTYKERNTTLKGANYATPVSYWMPFNGNIGMHDSSWRKSYGKNIYKKNGSHGCINLPPDVAQIIYENTSSVLSAWRNRVGIIRTGNGRYANTRGGRACNRYGTAGNRCRTARNGYTGTRNRCGTARNGYTGTRNRYRTARNGYTGTRNRCRTARNGYTAARSWNRSTSSCRSSSRGTAADTRCCCNSNRVGTVCPCSWQNETNN